jgi:hypothetical protein
MIRIEAPFQITAALRSYLQEQAGELPKKADRRAQ